MSSFVTKKKTFFSTFFMNKLMRQHFMQILKICRENWMLNSIKWKASTKQIKVIEDLFCMIERKTFNYAIQHKFPWKDFHSIKNSKVEKKCKYLKAALSQASGVSTAGKFSVVKSTFSKLSTLEVGCIFNRFSKYEL